MEPTPQYGFGFKEEVEGPREPVDVQMMRKLHFELNHQRTEVTTERDAYIDHRGGDALHARIITGLSDLPDELSSRDVAG
jgi:hypothetical protein